MVLDSRQQARKDKRRSRRFKSPNTDRMYGIYDPVRRLYLYYRTAAMRNRKLKEYMRTGYVSELACKLSRRKK